MNFKIEEIEIKNLDHLGIVSGIIDKIGIVEKVTELLGADSREKINCGEVVKAIILNGLGFVAQPLYLFSNFFKDKAMFGKILVEYSQQADFESIIIADSALYSAKNLILIKDLKWISRVPLSIKKAKDLVKTVKNESLKDIVSGDPKRSGSKGYQYSSSQMTYGGIEQRWMVVESEERKKSDLKKILDRLEKEAEKASKEINKITKLEFEQVSLALTEIEQIQARLKYHQIVQIETFIQINKKG